MDRVEREALAAGLLPALRKVASSLARRTGAEAEEVLADGLLGLAAAFDTYDPARGPAAPYLATKARLAMLDGLRCAEGPLARTARRRRPRFLSLDVSRLVAGREGGERHRPCLDAALRALPAREREAVTLRWLHGWPLERIARRLGCHDSWVSRLVTSGLGLLRERLAPAGGAGCP